MHSNHHHHHHISSSTSPSSSSCSLMEETKPKEFNSLPKDLTLDIFSRLPLKTLCRLRCVCKKWLFSLNLDPEFIAFYHHKHKISPLLVFTPQINETPSTQLFSYYIDGTQLNQFSTNFAHPLAFILGCNGVLCLISNSSASFYDPITKRVSNLPNSAHFGSTFGWAFGHVSNPFHSDLKLLHFYTTEKFDNFHYCQLKEVMCEIMTEPSSHLRSNSHGQWRFLGKCPFDFLGRKQYAHVDGKIYWLIAEKKFNPDCIKIMSFHLRNENFGVVCFPKTNSNRSVECLDLVEIQDRLCLTDRLPWGSMMDIWMMKREEDFANLWVKKYKIDLVGIDHHDVRILGHLPNINDGEDEGEILIKFGAQSFGLYNLGNGGFRDMAGEMNIQGRDLKLLLNRRCL